MHAFDRRTDDGQTEFSSLDRVCIPCDSYMSLSRDANFRSIVLLGLAWTDTHTDIDWQTDGRHWNNTHFAQSYCSSVTVAEWSWWGSSSSKAAIVARTTTQANINHTGRERSQGADVYCDALPSYTASILQYTAAEAGMMRPGVISGSARRQLDKRDVCTSMSSR